MLIRPACADDFEAILRLNSEAVTATSPLDEAGLARLDGHAVFHRVAEVDGTVGAFLIAIREGAGYDSVNYRWFMDAYERFLYVDRIVVAAEYRRAGLGAALYDDLFGFARQVDEPLVTCEINIEPPNDASHRFHARRGFAEVGTQWVAGGTKRVSMQVAFVGQRAKE